MESKHLLERADAMQASARGLSYHALRESAAKHLLNEAAMLIRTLTAERDKLRLQVDSRIPMDQVSSLRWRVRELEAQLADLCGMPPPAEKQALAGDQQTEACGYEACDCRLSCKLQQAETDKRCTYCGRDGHRANACPLRNDSGCRHDRQVRQSTGDGSVVLFCPSCGANEVTGETLGCEGPAP